MTVRDRVRFGRSRRTQTVAVPVPHEELFGVLTHDGLLVGAVTVHEDCLVLRDDSGSLPTILLPGDIVRIVPYRG